MSFNNTHSLAKHLNEHDADPIIHDPAFRYRQDAVEMMAQRVPDALNLSDDRDSAIQCCEVCITACSPSTGDVNIIIVEVLRRRIEDELTVSLSRPWKTGKGKLGLCRESQPIFLSLPTEIGSPGDVLEQRMNFTSKRECHCYRSGNNEATHDRQNEVRVRIRSSQGLAVTSQASQSHFL